MELVFIFFNSILLIFFFFSYLKSINYTNSTSIVWNDLNNGDIWQLKHEKTLSFFGYLCNEYLHSNSQINAVTLFLQKFKEMQEQLIPSNISEETNKRKMKSKTVEDDLDESPPKKGKKKKTSKKRDSSDEFEEVVVNEQKEEGNRLSNVVKLKRVNKSKIKTSRSKQQSKERIEESESEDLNITEEDNEEQNYEKQKDKLSKVAAIPILALPVSGDISK